MSRDSDVAAQPQRDPVCVERWPECESGAYDPRCCRFPKSCSCTSYPPDESPAATMQDRPPNFRENGKLYLVRCFNCGGERGTENYALAVATGTCAFCGWCEGRFREVEVNV